MTKPFDRQCAETMRARAERIASACGLTVEDMIGPARQRRVSRVRHLVMADLYRFGFGPAAIGRFLGNRSKATVLYGVEMVRQKAAKLKEPA